MNLFAVVYGVAMMVNIAWPRQAVYDPAGTSWVLQFLALLFVAGMVVVGLLVHRALRVRTAPAAVDVTVDAAAAVAEA
ncbi:MAG: hypothetical protein JO287_16450 [Pseudonocardiales bacterium]|nr:hypothetical protein [Pseudonocardiales bacterium]